MLRVVGFFNGIDESIFWIEDRISVTGIPQFDPYADVVSPSDKEQFLISQDLDPGKPTVLFATSAGGDTPEEPEILERLVLALNETHAGDIQFLEWATSPSCASHRFGQQVLEEVVIGVGIRLSSVGRPQVEGPAGQNGYVTTGAVDIEVKELLALLSRDVTVERPQLEVRLLV